LGRGHLAVLTLWRVGAHGDRLGWPVDPRHRADDSFWAGASTGMTYSPARNDLAEDVPRSTGSTSACWTTRSITRARRAKLAWYASHDILPGSTVVEERALCCGQARGTAPKTSTALYAESAKPPCRRRLPGPKLSHTAQAPSATEARAVARPLIAHHQGRSRPRSVPPVRSSPSSAPMSSSES
jgi:hypothetical protein